MKKLKLLFVSVLLFGLTGCVTIDTNIVINKDKSIDFSMTEEIDLSGLEDMEGTSSSEETNTEVLENKGYTIETYDNDGVTGYKISKTFSSIDEVTDLTNSNTKFVVEKWFDDGNDNNMFTLKDGVYYANWVMTEDSETEEVDSSSVEMMNSLISITYTITLPNKPLSHNATSVSEDGKTLVYNVKYGEDSKMNDIQFSFDFATESNKIESNEIDNMLYYIIGGSALIIIILVIVIVSIIKRKNKKDGVSVVEPQNEKVENNLKQEQTTNHIEEVSNQQQGQVVQPRPIQQQGQAVQPRPMPQQGQGVQPRPVPQQGQVVQPRPMPQQGQGVQPRPMPQQEQEQQNNNQE